MTAFFVLGASTIRVSRTGRSLIVSCPCWDARFPGLESQDCIRFCGSRSHFSSNDYLQRFPSSHRHLYEVEGLSIRRIASTLGLSRKKLYRVINNEAIPKARHPSILQPYERLIEVWYKTYPSLEATQVCSGMCGRIRPEYAFKTISPEKNVNSSHHFSRECRIPVREISQLLEIFRNV
jgi:hypothetical protein